MFYVDFRDFPNDPYYFGFNSAGQKNLVLVFFFTFQELPDSKGRKVSGHSSQILRCIQQAKVAN
jgi:hypothetical protein